VDSSRVRLLKRDLIVLISERVLKGLVWVELSLLYNEVFVIAFVNKPLIHKVIDAF